MSETIGDWRDRPWGSPWAFDAATTDAAGAITEIGLRRDMCYGPCPVYEVSFTRSGDARFVGEYFVDMIGPYAASIVVDDFGVLARAAVHLGFDTLDRNYAVDYTDAPTMTIWIVRNGERIAVEDYGGAGPAALRVIETLIDAAASELDWRPEAASRTDDDGLPIFAGMHVDASRRPENVSGEEPHWTQTGRRIR
jgi:hypothetical protein